MIYLMEAQTWREQMRIEIAEPGRMTQTGSSLLRLIQNNDMPVLDLLVRESIQNSLDARKPNAKYVDVEYQTGTFQSKLLSAQLEGITDNLNSRYGNSQAEFIAVKDSNTVGLTGEMNYKKVKDNKYGNLLKLIYEICKPQEAAGAGGSWGLGKTVYFRIGIGLVVYYSRIKMSDGSYQSRLAASLVEKETHSSAMIPVYKDQAKRGIAWWGELVDENVTQPITDETYISKFLEIFGIEVYSGEKTGTVIIIPYINSNELLSNNQIEYLTSEGKTFTPYWCKSLDTYLSIATQRWYAPRLSNSHFIHGAYLRLKINGIGLAAVEMEPVFKVIRALYNRANNVIEDDILSDGDCVVKSEPINVIKYLNDQVIGNVAYVKVGKELLKMCEPYNKPEPYKFLNCEIRDTEVNKPVVCFTRKPGMIVSYENIGAWTSGISPSNKDEYIIGLFVLNSWNTLKGAPEIDSLEEYIRRSEMADHTSWSDWSDGHYNPRLVTKIQTKVSSKIGNEFKPIEEEIPVKQNSGLGKLFGDMLLPPDGFGKGADGGKTPPKPKKGSPNRGLTFEIEKDKIEYLSSNIVFPVKLKTSSKRQITNATFRMLIDSDARKIEVTEWESKMGMRAPFKVNSIDISMSRYQNENVTESISLFENGHFEYRSLSISKVTTKEGTCIGFNITADEPTSLELIARVNVEVIRNDVKPAFVFEKEV